jgi:hypothetical protein
LLNAKRLRIVGPRETVSLTRGLRTIGKKEARRIRLLKSLGHDFGDALVIKLDIRSLLVENTIKGVEAFFELVFFSLAHVVT